MITLKSKARKITFIVIILLIMLTFFMSISSKNNDKFCLIDKNSTLPSDCLNVQNSIYGNIFGISLSLFGFISFTLLFIMHLISNTKHKHSKKFHNFFLIGVILGSAISIYFIYLQFFVLKMICTNCLIVDFSMILILLLVIYDISKGIR